MFKNEEKIKKIAWWIPIRSLRDKFREKKLKEFREKKLKESYEKSELKLAAVRWEIDSDSEEDYKKRQIIRKILINDENKNKSDLHEYFIENRDRGTNKILSYFDLYERHFSKFRGKDINILEIGVQNGGDLKMWEYYFTKDNPNVKVNIYGIDINEKAKEVEGGRIKIFIGSQSDRAFLKKVKSEIPKIDILIDDGGHEMEQQIVTFEEFYDHIKDNGIYWCEDICTSYWASHNGGYKKPTSYIEYTKKLIDYLNAYNATISDELEVSDFTNTTYGIHYYENIVVIEKKIRDPRYRNICQHALIGHNKFWKKKPEFKSKHF